MQTYGYALATVYAGLQLHFYLAGTWVIDRAGMPVYSDFTELWVAAKEALRGKAALIYEPAEFVRAQSALLGPRGFFYPNWPYRPTFLLILAPLGALRYFEALFVEYRDAAYLHRCHLSYRPAAAGDRSGARLAIYALEPPCRTEGIF